MPTKTDRILSYLPSTFRALPKPTALYSVVDAFGNELLHAENSLAALMLAHWVDHADKGAEQIDDLARLAALYGLAPQPEETVEEFREHLKRYVRTFLDGTVTVQGILRVTAEALGLHIADAYHLMDTWWTRENEPLISVDPRADDAAQLLFGSDSISVQGQDAQAAQLIGKVDLSTGFALNGSITLRLKLDANAPVDIDLTGLTTLEHVVQAINANVIGVASSRDGRLMLTSPTVGIASLLDVQECPNDAAPSLLGLRPYRYNGTVASHAQITGQADLSGGVDLSAVRYVRLLIDGQYLAEVDCAANASDATNVQLEQIKQAINDALTLTLATHDGKHLILTSPTTGFNSSIAFQPAAAQDARVQLFGAIDTFYAGRDARAAEVVSINDLSGGVDLSTRAKLRIKVDNHPAITMVCAGNEASHTLLSELTVLLNAHLGVGIATHDGRFLRLRSPSAGAASTIAFESLPADEDATELLFGISARVFSGAEASSAHLIGTPDLHAGVDLAAVHYLQLAIDNAEPLTINVRGKAVNSSEVKLSELVKAINLAVKKPVASDDTQHLILSSPTTGKTSRIDIKPLTVTHYRRFVTRAFITDDAAPTVFGFFAKTVHGTAATTAHVIGTPDLSRGIDLRKARFLRLAVDDGAAIDIDCAGTRPRATLLNEVVSIINAKLGKPIASHDDKHLLLTAGNRIHFEAPRSADAMTVLGITPSVFRGSDASRVTFIGVTELSGGINLPANATVKLRIDNDEFEIALTAAAPIHQTLQAIVIAINFTFNKTVAQHDGKHLILVSPSKGSDSRIELLVSSGTDSTQAVFGIPAPRHYRGQAAEPATVMSHDLPPTIDLSVAHILRIAVNGSDPIVIDCTNSIDEPKQATLAMIAPVIQQALNTTNLPITAKAEANKLILTTTTAGATSRIDVLAYTESDARQVLFGDIADLTTSDPSAPATLIGEVDLLTPVNLAESAVLRLSVDGARPVDINIAGIAPAATFLGEIITKINAVIPNLATATDNDHLCLTSPTTGENSRLAILPLRAIELIEYPPTPAQDPLQEQAARLVRHGDHWSVENDGAADTDLKIILTAPHGVFGAGFVNHTSGVRIRLMMVVHPNERVELWREAAGTIHANLITPDGTSHNIANTHILVEKLAGHKNCTSGGEHNKAAALILPQGRSEWAYLDCHGTRFNQDYFNAARFTGKSCTERGVFNVSRFSCPPPSKQTSVFTSTAAQANPPVEVRFYWQHYQTGAFTINLPADLPERFGARFNQARFAKDKDTPETFSNVVTEPITDADFLVTRIKHSTLVTATQVDRVPLGFVVATLPFRKPRRLTGGSNTSFAYLYLAEKDVAGFIEIKTLKQGAFGNAIAVTARKSAPARFDVTIRYQAARFENARQAVLGGTELPALTDDLLKPSPVGVLQAKAGGIKAKVTRDRAAPND